MAPSTPEVVRRVESLVDSLWVGGHLASPNPSPEAIVWLARLVEQTRRAEVGTATLVLPWYSPAVAAKQLADLDRASNGRLIVGVGGGGEYPDDFVAAGVPRQERWTRLDESMQLLRRFWSAEPVEHRGQHFCYDGLRIHPAPVRPGGPPLIVTGRKVGAMRRAALLGDGWMPYLYSPERYARSVAMIREVADEHGRSLHSFQWMAYVMVAVDKKPATARRTAVAFLGATYHQDVTEFVGRVTLAGDLQQVSDGLRSFVQAGAQHIVLLPCSDTPQSAMVPWLPDLVAEVRAG